MVSTFEGLSTHKRDFEQEGDMHRAEAAEGLAE